ncbi:YkvA family protein [uncultured Dysgonomonas sp.]|uniref:YkvA family protein n=1 Tax=uncultured Dysgonomonas sp. TaxID=206096 RepID=UPI002631DB69|nr:YkvA family protein [uncultured Dysgonomonas sp.]
MKFIEKLKLKAKLLKTELIAIYLAMKDNRTPLFTKIMIALTISYAFSPVDLIPDFIPILGYLDDLVLLPLMIRMCIKLIPPKVLAECRIKARENIWLNRKVGLYSAFLIILLWLSIIVLLIIKLK